MSDLIAWLRQPITLQNYEFVLLSCWAFLGMTSGWGRS